MISKLLNMLTRKEYIPQIIHFLKNITLIYNFELRTTIQKNIKDVLTYVIANKTSGRVSEEDANDIGVIISFINNNRSYYIYVTWYLSPKSTLSVNYMKIRSEGRLSINDFFLNKSIIKPWNLMYHSRRMSSEDVQNGF